MLDGCGIETTSAVGGRSRSRDRCSMIVGSRHPSADVHQRAITFGRDRCSMIVGSRLLEVAYGQQHRRAPRVAIDARWLWDRDAGRTPVALSRRDRCSMTVGSRPVLVLTAGRSAGRRDRCSMAVGSRLRPARCTSASRPWSRSMLDGCGIETAASATCNAASSVAIDARWLWDRELTRLGRPARRPHVAIDARWLWDRDWLRCRAPRPSRSMLDGCGIETSRPRASRGRSRSMLDGCGIETRRGRRRRAVGL